MPIIERVWPWEGQPQEQAVLNQDNWFARTATELICPTQSLLSGMTPQIAGATLEPGPAGVAFRGPRVVGAGTQHTQNFWALAVARINTSYTGQIFISQGGFASSFGWALAVNDVNGAELAALYGGVAWNRISGSVLQVGQTYAILLVVSAGSSRVDFWVNGRYHGGANASSIAAAGVSPTAILACTGGGDPNNWAGGGSHSMYLAAVGAGNPPGQFSSEITADPWQLFEPRRIFVPVAAAAASATSFPPRRRQSNLLLL